MLPVGSTVTPARAADGGVVGGVSEASWQAEPQAAGRTGCQLTSLLAPSLPRLSWAPSPAPCRVPSGAVPPPSNQPASSALRPLPAPQADRCPGTSENGGSLQSCSERSPRPAGLSPGHQVSAGSTRRLHPDLRSALHPLLRGSEGVVLCRSPSPQPGHLSPFFRAGPSSAPFLLNRYNTRAAPPHTRPLPPSPFPFPKLSALALEFTAAKKHTHTHAQNQLWDVFPLPSGGL